jgi:acyl-CoA dehydrogenase
MGWDFETEPEFQEKLDWIDSFLTEEIEPLDFVLGNPYDKTNKRVIDLVKPLQQQVRDQGLWACHLGPELGGAGYGQVKLALMNELLGRSGWAPTIFGCQAPDSGNAEILAHYGTEGQKQRYLSPLLNGEISSCYSMTEPHAGADPTLFTTRLERDGDEWVLNGEKWFSSNARFASFFIVMAVSNPDVSAYQGMSMAIVPAETPGIEILRNVGIGSEPDHEGSHAYIRYTNVRIPHENLLGGEGQAFAIAQTRLGGGRIHHAMRTIATVKQAFDMMCERALARNTRQGALATMQLTQQKIADSWIQIESFRLLVLRTAWLIDKHHDYRKVRKDISAIKAAMPTVLYDVVQRSMHLHGSLGISNEMPFSRWMVSAEALALADGPTEVHQLALARDLLKTYKPHEGLFPNGHLPARREAARLKLADFLEREAAEL